MYDKIRGIKMDEYGFVNVNCNRQLKTNEPFILATQASCALHAIVNVNKDWHVARDVVQRFES